MKKLIAAVLLLGCGVAQAATIVVDVVDSMTINVTLIGPLRGPAPVTEFPTTLWIDIPVPANIQAWAWETFGGTAKIGTDSLYQAGSGFGPPGEPFSGGLYLAAKKDCPSAVGGVCFFEAGDQLSGTSSFTFNKEHEITQDMFDNGAPIYWGGGTLESSTFQGNAISGISAIPIPAAVYLFASGLGLLGWFRRRQTA
jgi:hypothetical protein